ncbi:hypothetical protein [Caballeronia sp. DA-9]|uniref:hypothetical protein n=1 Tax=Caballeronia sp. DA-9 TaxID=3436237 RepID=UPI003F669F9F
MPIPDFDDAVTVQAPGARHVTNLSVSLKEIAALREEGYVTLHSLLAESRIADSETEASHFVPFVVEVNSNYGSTVNRSPYSTGEIDVDQNLSSDRAFCKLGFAEFLLHPAARPGTQHPDPTRSGGRGAGRRRYDVCARGHLIRPSQFPAFQPFILEDGSRRVTRRDRGPTKADLHDTGPFAGLMEELMEEADSAPSDTFFFTK